MDFTTSVADYPAADGWTFKIRLVSRSGSSATIEITASTSGDDYRVQVAPSVSGAWDAGDYGWTSWVEKTGARHTIEAGQITILPDPETSPAGGDTRSQAEKAVADLKLAFATYTASQGHVAEYEIAGRRMKFASADDIIKKINFWKYEVVREQQAARLAQGLPARNKLMVRF